MMKVDRLETGAVTVLRLRGEIDEEGVDTLRLSLAHCLQDRRTRVVVNVSDVRFISYLGVGVLVERLQQFRAQGGDLKLSGVNLYMERLLRMASVLHFFTVCDSEPQAIEAFRAAA